MEETVCRNLNICKSITLITSIGFTDWFASGELVLILWYEAKMGQDLETLPLCVTSPPAENGDRDLPYVHSYPVLAANSCLALSRKLPYRLDRNAITGHLYL